MSKNAREKAFEDLQQTVYRVTKTEQDLLDVAQARGGGVLICYPVWRWQYLENGTAYDCGGDYETRAECETAARKSEWAKKNTPLLFP